MKRLDFLMTLFGLGGVAKAAPLVTKPLSKKVFVEAVVRKIKNMDMPVWDMRFSEVNQSGVIQNRVNMCGVDHVPHMLEVMRRNPQELGGIGSYTPALRKAFEHIITTGEKVGFTAIYEI